MSIICTRRWASVKGRQRVVQMNTIEQDKVSGSVRTNVEPLTLTRSLASVVRVYRTQAVRCRCDAAPAGCHSSSSGRSHRGKLARTHDLTLISNISSSPEPTSGCFSYLKLPEFWQQAQAIRKLRELASHFQQLPTEQHERRQLPRMRRQRR